MSLDKRKIFRKMFYQVKPLIPRRLQILLRQWLVTRQIHKYQDIWPILPGSEKKPDNWKNWHQGKKFAVILTHDVESAEGMHKCLRLAALEKELGFRSLFNFVPEKYVTPNSLRQELTKQGFEIGVHGLNHDGKLFSSYKIFSERTPKINYYLKQWNAVGFRAPAMHHRLDWIWQLDIKYDLSTFDTDPFEPQSDGVGTIFPFLIETNDPNRKIVEMPYTLVQDFTLFILMKKGIEIWTKKLDWIAKNGGMALLNTHPDYMSFDETRTKSDKYPVQLYIDFLNYITSNYKNQYWNVLPKELANFVQMV